MSVLVAIAISLSKHLIMHSKWIQQRSRTEHWTTLFTQNVLTQWQCGNYRDRISMYFHPCCQLSSLYLLCSSESYTVEQLVKQIRLACLWIALRVSAPEPHKIVTKWLPSWNPLFFIHGWVHSHGVSSQNMHMCEPNVKTLIRPREGPAYVTAP